MSRKPKGAGTYTRYFQHSHTPACLICTSTHTRGSFSLFCPWVWACLTYCTSSLLCDAHLSFPLSSIPPLRHTHTHYTGGRNALTQDLIRDNLEDLDLDPYAPQVDESSGSELYPQIAPPLSSALLNREAAFCLLKRALFSRRCKLTPLHTPEETGGIDGGNNVYSSRSSGYFVGSGSSSSSSSSSGSSGSSRHALAAALKGVISTTSMPGRYFPDELLAGLTGGAKQQKRRAGAVGKGKTNSRGGRTRSNSHGDYFGKLETRERMGGGGAGNDATGGGDGDDGGKDSTILRDKEGAVDPADNSEGDEEEDEYALDDDYGLAHGMSDDDGGDDDDGDEAVF